MVGDGRTMWMRRYRSAPNATGRLVCFPHAGGSASYFLPLCRALPPTIDMLAVQYPGRQDRHLEELIDDIATLADRLSPIMAAEWDGLPTVFFGHSMGATVAFEVARSLEKRGIFLEELVVSSRRGPTAIRDELIHRLPDAELMQHVRSLSGTQAEILDDPEMVRVVLPVLRNDYTAVETYRYQPGPDVSCPITALIGDHDPQVTVEEAKTWAEQTSGAFDLEVFAGGHFYLNDEWPELVRRCTSALPLARSGEPS